MKIFLSGAHNKPSGGAKVINQVANLFNEKGYEAYKVISGKPYKADFIDNPAETIGFDDMVKICKKEDVIIDCWQLVESWNATKNSKARRKVFWQHGASIPVGRKYIGPRVFGKNTIYTYQWNVSEACKEYIQKKYSVDKIDVVHPFFDSETLKRYSAQRLIHKRNGILCLASRGSHYIPKIIRAFGSKTKITVIHGYYREEEFFEELIRHKFFVSVDDGVRNRPLKRIKRKLLSLINPEMRDANSWIVPKNHLLGFPMPPAEAARCGAVVIGFAMGGGLEWMNKSNCYLAKDRDLNSLLFNIKKALSTSEKELTKISKATYEATNKFNKEHTWKQICSSLGIK
jgi:glycosyltransferase involved in cell wall biosynthesis